MFVRGAVGAFGVFGRGFVVGRGVVGVGAGRGLWRVPVFGSRSVSECDSVLDEVVGRLEAVEVSSNVLPEVDSVLRGMSPSDLQREKSGAELRVLANHAFHGEGTRRDVYLATVLWTFAAKKGDVESLYSLAQCTRDGVGAPGELWGGPNEEVALEMLEDLVRQVPHGWSMFAIATILMRRVSSEGGVASEAVEKRAMEMYRGAADHGVAPACLSLSNFFFLGLGGQEVDEKKGLFWLRKAAQLGDPIAQTQLGHRLSEGKGVGKDEKKAFQLFERAAAMGRPSSLHNLGVAYMSGVGVEKDEAKAVGYFRQAAKLGNLASKWNLAHMLEAGRGCVQDFDQALQLLQEIQQEGFAEDVEESIAQIARRRDIARAAKIDASSSLGESDVVKEEGGREVEKKEEDEEEEEEVVVAELGRRVEDARGAHVFEIRHTDDTVEGGEMEDGGGGGGGGGGEGVVVGDVVEVEVGSEGVEKAGTRRRRRRRRKKESGVGGGGGEGGGGGGVVESQRPTLQVAIDTAGMKDPEQIGETLRQLAEMGDTRQDKVMDWLLEKAKEQGFAIRHVMTTKKTKKSKKTQKKAAAGEGRGEGGGDKK